MAVLKIREYNRMGLVQCAGVLLASPMADEAADVVDQPALTFAGASTQSAAFAKTTKFIGVKGSVAWAYSIGSNPTATVDMIDVAAGVVIYLGVAPGLKIAVIAA